jgi:hypothetical protein
MRPVVNSSNLSNFDQTALLLASIILTCRDGVSGYQSELRRRHRDLPSRQVVSKPCSGGFGLLLRVRHCESGGALDITNLRAASVPAVHSVQGRGRRCGKHDAIVEERSRGGLC